MNAPPTVLNNLPTSAGYYRAEAAYADLLRRVGLVDGLSVFEHDKIGAWRSITERENCVLDYDGGRLHIKRNKPGHRGVDDEAAAIRLLMDAGLGTVPLVAAGRLNDGRGFLITDDLAGYEDADVAVRNGRAFETILDATADLAGRLHKAGLHHRDLYLCHFYVKTPTPVEATYTSPDDAEPAPPRDVYVAPTQTEARLMDAGRVKPLPSWFRRRWLVKDVAQFVYSLRQLNVPTPLENQWLAQYAAAGGAAIDASFRKAIERKVSTIAKHDVALRRREPTRNVSIDR